MRYINRSGNAAFFRREYSIVPVGLGFIVNLRSIDLDGGSTDGVVRTVTADGFKRPRQRGFVVDRIYRFGDGQPHVSPIIGITFPSSQATTSLVDKDQICTHDGATRGVRYPTYLAALGVPGEYGFGDCHFVSFDLCDKHISVIDTERLGRDLYGIILADLADLDALSRQHTEQCVTCSCGTVTPHRFSIVPSGSGPRYTPGRHREDRIAFLKIWLVVHIVDRRAVTTRNRGNIQAQGVGNEFVERKHALDPVIKGFILSVPDSIDDCRFSLGKRICGGISILGSSFALALQTGTGVKGECNVGNDRLPGYAILSTNVTASSG